MQKIYCLPFIEILLLFQPCINGFKRADAPKSTVTAAFFDTYENDAKMNLIIKKLDNISLQLDAIAENQTMLYNEVKRGNEIAERTYQSVKQIENNTDRIARDTSDIKTNSEIIARNTAQQTWIQEYAYYRSLYY